MASPPSYHPFHKLLQTHLKTSSTCLCQQPGSVKGYGKEMAPLGMGLGLSPWRATPMGLCGGLPLHCLPPCRLGPMSPTEVPPNYRSPGVARGPAPLPRPVRLKECRVVDKERQEDGEGPEQQCGEELGDDGVLQEERCQTPPQEPAGAQPCWRQLPRPPGTGWCLQQVGWGTPFLRRGICFRR